MSVAPRKGSPYFWYSFNIDGDRFRGSTGQKTKKAAEQFEREERVRVKEARIPKEDWTLGVVLTTYWLGHAKDTRSAGHIEGNLAYLQRILGTNLKTSELTGGKLLDYRATRRGEAYNKRFPKAHTINRELAYLHAAYEHCRRWHKQAMPDVDWKGLKAKEPTWRTRFLSREAEAPRLMAAMCPSVREIVICAIVTGLRKGPILLLEWGPNVDLDEKKITVIGKGGKEQVVKIPPALMAILSTKPLRKGRVFDTTNFRRRWNAAVKDAGLANFRFHDLRHTFASWARKNGIDLATLKQALNHADISMTMRYANVEPDEVETTFDKVSATLMGTIQGTTTKKTAENSQKHGD